MLERRDAALKKAQAELASAEARTPRHMLLASLSRVPLSIVRAYPFYRVVSRYSGRVFRPLLGLYWVHRTHTDFSFPLPFTETVEAGRGDPRVFFETLMKAETLPEQKNLRLLIEDQLKILHSKKRPLQMAHRGVRLMYRCVSP